VVLIGGLLLALVVSAVVASRERSIAAAVNETNARNEELALIARTGPLLQESLALGDLLPVFVVEVSDELRLDGTSVSLVSDTGQLVRVFSLGAGAGPHSTDLGELSPLPASVRPGELITVPLRRAGRVIGAFEGRAAVGLTPPQIETLVAVCNLLAAALGNVRLFQDEQDMVARLRDVDRMKTTFVSSISHELHTTVTAIEGFAGLLKTGAPAEDPARRADYIERISRNARSLNLLVEDLLDFARFQRSGLAVALGPVDLSDLVPTVVDQMSSVLAGRTVSTNIEPGVTAIADALAVERILVNLLSNAAKHTPLGSGVTVELERDGDDAVLSVTDHGPGVPAEDRQRIFELFYRSDDSARTTRGVGIGLALAGQLVAHLNGTIGVDTAPEGGARFVVTIPLVDDAMPSSLPVARPHAHLDSGG
jgi:signal transduction histidine kinase